MPISNATWHAGELSVNIRHHLGLRMTNGQTAAALLYLKQAPLTPASANVGVRIMHQSMTTVLPGAEAVVIDVRRGRLFRLRRNQGVSSLDSWIASEAVGYVFHWNGRLASSATGASVHPGQGPCRSGLSVIATAAERPQRAA